MRYVEWVEPFYTYPTGETIGPVYLRLSVSSAIEYRKFVGSLNGFTYENDQQALDDFLTIYWGRIVQEEENESN